MDAKKYTKPKLPTAQNILEDIANIDDKRCDSIQLCSDDDILKEAYACFHNFESLQSDLVQRSELKIKLEQLDLNLAENIEKIGKQTN